MEINKQRTFKCVSSLSGFTIGNEYTERPGDPGWFFNDEGKSHGIVESIIAKYFKLIESKPLDSPAAVRDFYAKRENIDEDMRHHLTDEELLTAMETYHREQTASIIQQTLQYVAENAQAYSPSPFISDFDNIDDYLEIYPPSAIVYKEGILNMAPDIIKLIK